MEEKKEVLEGVCVEARLVRQKQEREKEKEREREKEKEEQQELKKRRE
jgi:hypothetical protein